MTEVRRRSGRTFFLGTVIIALGILLLLSNLDMMPFSLHELLFSWESILIIIGIVMIANDNYRGGFILIAIGALFMISRYYTMDSMTLWPVLLILLGLYILFNVGRHPRYNRKYYRDYGRETAERIKEQVSETVAEQVSSHFKEKYYDKKRTISEDFLDETSVFSGTKKSITSDNFKGGKITSIFGGSEIDLYNCRLAPGDNILEVTCIFGGTTLYIPRDWKVVVDVTPVFGGFSDERRKDPSITYNDDRKLIIKGALIFGGGEIKTA
ncbi:MAG TPA: DUF5668 domain-containing protein [Ignavibacteriales bacterium]|nr:DUF5668 domain-containing protein [Ignavibacteriales bacterium]